MATNTNSKRRKSKEVKYIYRKKKSLFSLLKKIKLWPSRSGILHGIKNIDIKGNYADIELHCGQKLRIKNSKNSRAARWLRNKWLVKTCSDCGVPEWKLEKYSKTVFK